MNKTHDIAKEADVIICGYAYSKGDDGVKVFNLKTGKGAAQFKSDGTLIETNMDDIELSIARKYLLESVEYMEAL